MKIDENNVDAQIIPILLVHHGVRRMHRRTFEFSAGLLFLYRILPRFAKYQRRMN